MMGLINTTNPDVTNRKLRVAMVAPTFPLEEGRVNGGVQGASLYLSQALAEIPGIELHVIVPSNLEETSKISNIYGLNVHLLKLKKINASLASMMDLRLMFKLINELDVDIVHFQGLPRWANQCSLPNVVTIHGISERDVLYHGFYLTSRIKFLIVRQIERKARFNSRNIIVINPYVRKFLSFHRGQMVWDVPNPISKEFFSINYRPIVGRIFSAGNIIPRKNVHGLIRAFSQIASYDNQVELRIAGSYQESDYGKQCRSIVNSLGLSERVKFLGLLTLEQIQEELSQAACFALCSFQETAPLSISEAMAAGVPVVASNAGGIPWMVEDGVTGVLVDAKDIDAIARGLKQILLSNTNSQMGLEAKQKARTLFYPTEVAKKTVEVYCEILSDNDVL